ncbi:MAG: hypothetical protein ACKVVT_04630 [Dehalococcoidia bacterium]
MIASGLGTGGRVALLLVAVVAFSAFAGSRAVNGVILNEDFYLSALEDGDVFGQVFDAMLEDPEAFLDPETLIDDLTSLFDGDSSFELPTADEIITGADDALTAIDTSLDDFSRVVDIFNALEPVALLVFLAALVVLGLSLLRDWARLCRWVGVAMAASGGVALMLWFGLQGVVEDLVVDVALDDAGDVPESFRTIMKSAVVAAIDNLSPEVVVPCVLTLAVGGALVLASFALGPAGRRT